MNWQPFLTKLNKIKILAENANNEGEISRLERDLLASYVRDLYEYLWDSETQQSPPKPAGIQVQKPVSQQPATPAPVQETIITRPSEPPVQPVITEEPKPVVQETPARASQVIQEPVTPVAEAAPAEIAQTITTKVPTPVSNGKKADPALLSELFIEEKVSDLSDKLASQKINDLTKAMGINEKIFTIQELFNNDNNLFNTALGHLNSLPDFTEAKAYISDELVPKLDWTSEKKIKKAATFIKLVRRRYM
jgi:hypothetical protein